MRNMRRMIAPALLSAGVIALIGTTAGAQRSQTAQPGIRLDDANGSERGQTKRFTQRQVENVHARIATANAIVSRFESEASRIGRLSVWRQSTLETLFALSFPALQYVQQNAHSLDSLAAVVREAADDPNLIGDPSADLVYTPVNPCRYIDTRGGPIVAPAAPRGYDLANSGASYGGSASCSLPQTTTAAIAMNVTITEPVGHPAFLAVKPTLAAPTTSFMNWYESGPGVQLANAGVVTVDQSGGANEFFIIVSSPTHVIVDFFGFFAEPAVTPVDQFVVLTTNAIAASANFTIFSPVCPANYRVTGGGHRAANFDAPARLSSSRPAAGNSTAVVSGANAGTQWLCQGLNSALAQDIECYAICARIPGR